MELGLKIFTAETEGVFPRCDMNVWLSEADYARLFDGLSVPRGPRYVKIACKAILSPFTFFAKLAVLNAKVAFPNGYIWVPKELMHRSWIYEKTSRVEVTVVDADSMPLAESVVISLKPEEVANWSDDEVRNAEMDILAHAGLTFDSQMLFVKPGTKRVVMGEVDAIFPTPKERHTVFAIDSEQTKVNLKGIPTNRQKVIDFSQIGGLDKVIGKLREIIQIPMTYPELLTRFGIKPPKGMLMYGPPGNGKTMIARAVAYSMGSAFITIEGPELMSKYVGEGERKLREKFDEAESKGNCVIFIDEIDSVASVRSEASAEFQVSMVATLLNLMDGMKSTNRVFVIGATNRLNAIDPALRRPGRFDLEFEVPLPDLDARQDILSKYVRLERDHLFSPTVGEKLLLLLGELTNGYSGADLSLLYREAVMGAIRKNMQLDVATGKIRLTKDSNLIRLDEADFYEAMKGIVPTSMRGMDIERSTVGWNEIVGLDNVKAELEQLNRRFSLFVADDTICQRPSFANIIVVGRKGSGRRTLVTAFARQFGYELMTIDFIALASRPLNEAFYEIDQFFMKCRQMAPVVMMFRNLDKVPDGELYGNKLTAELGKFNKHLKAIAVIVAEQEQRLPESVFGYKAFDRLFRLELDADAMRQALKKLMGIDVAPDSDLLGMTIGQAISQLKEQQLNEKYGL